MSNLVIVESPAKAKTIEGFLGSDFTVRSCYGHIRELPKKGERWSAIEAVPFAAAQQWGGMGDTLMTTEKASLAFSILKKSCLEVRVRLRSRSSLE